MRQCNLYILLNNEVMFISNPLVHIDERINERKKMAHAKEGAK